MQKRLYVLSTYSLSGGHRCWNVHPLTTLIFGRYCIVRFIIWVVVFYSSAALILDILFCALWHLSGVSPFHLLLLQTPCKAIALIAFLPYTLYRFLSFLIKQQNCCIFVKNSTAFNFIFYFTQTQRHRLKDWRCLDCHCSVFLTSEKTLAFSINCSHTKTLVQQIIGVCTLVLSSPNVR